MRADAHHMFSSSRTSPGRPAIGHRNYAYDEDGVLRGHGYRAACAECGYDSGYLPTVRASVAAAAAHRCG